MNQINPKVHTIRSGSHKCELRVLTLRPGEFLEKAEGNEDLEISDNQSRRPLRAAFAGSPFRAEDDHASRAVSGHLLSANPMHACKQPSRSRPSVMLQPSKCLTVSLRYRSTKKEFYIRWLNSLRVLVTEYRITIEFRPPTHMNRIPNALAEAFRSLAFVGASEIQWCWAPVPDYLLGSTMEEVDSMEAFRQRQPD